MTMFLGFPDARGPKAGFERADTVRRKITTDGSSCSATARA